LIDAVPVDEVANAACEKLRAAMGKEACMLKFSETPLTEALQIISDKHGLPIRIDTPALEEVGIDPKAALISASLEGQSLSQALRRMLKPCDLIWQLGQDVILVTTPEEEQLNLVTKIYPVRDLIAFDHDPLSDAHPGDDDFRSVTNAIEATVQPHSWVAVGGTAWLEPFAQTAAIVVTQTEAGHEEIAGLLAQVRRSRAQQKKDEPEAEAVEGDGARSGDGTGPVSGGAKPPAAMVNKQGEKLYLKVYRLSSDEREDARDLAETIRELIEPGNWTAEENYYLRPLAGALIIRHTAATHRKIHKLLTELDALPWPSSKPQLPGLGGPPVVGQRGQRSGLGAGVLQGGVFSIGEQVWPVR
jgi:hypothetical protein